MFIFMPNEEKIKPKLFFPTDFPEKRKEKMRDLFKKLPPLSQNQLSLTGVELETDNPEYLVVSAFVQSTLEKPVLLPSTKIQLRDKKLNPLLEKEEKFLNLPQLESNQAFPLRIKFKKGKLEIIHPNQFDGWSLAFADQLEHQVDFSDLNPEKITEEMITKLNQLIKNDPLDTNELAFVGFDAIEDATGNLLVNLLIRNGTKDKLVVKQVPLKFYDASDRLVAEGTFQFSNLEILPHTTKPITLTFPVDSLLEDNLDLTSWSIEHQA